MSVTIDGCDVEVQSHMQMFLDRLGASLGLERVFELSLKDPKHALSVLTEVRRAVEAEQRKAQAIFQLSQQAASVPAVPLSPVYPTDDASLLLQ